MARYRYTFAMTALLTLPLGACSEAIEPTATEQDAPNLVELQIDGRTVLAEDTGESYIVGSDRRFSKQDVDNGLLEKGLPRGGRWPNATVYYRIHSSLDGSQETNVLNAMRHIEKLSMIRFVADYSKSHGYLKIAKASDRHFCGADLGYFQGTVSNMELGKNCGSEQHIVTHEMAHVVNLDHEHERSIAPDYVRAANPDRTIVGGPYYGIGEFDFESITLYSSPTLYKKDGGWLNTKHGLSVGDIRSIYDHYPGYDSAKIAFKLKTSDKGWISANNGDDDLTTDRHEPKSQETFRIHTKPDGTISFQCHSGKFVSMGSKNLICNRDELDRWEKFKIRWIDHNEFVLQCHNGKWVAKQGSDRLRCSKPWFTHENTRFQLRDMD